MKQGFLILTIVLIAAQLQSQTSIQLIMKKNDNYKIEKVDFFDLSQKEFHEAPYKDTLNFTFFKKNIDCYNIRYHANGKMYRQQIWLDPGAITLKVHIDDPQLIIDSVYNSPVYYEHLSFSNTYRELYAKKDTAAMTDMLLKLYTKHIDDPYSILIGDYYIRLNQNSKKELLKLNTLVQQQGDKFNWFFSYPLVQEKLQNILSRTSVNINEYAFINTKNKQVKIPAFTNSKYYILDFWFLACAPCIRDHKQIFENQQLLATKKAALISISIDNNIKDWTNYLMKHKYNWPNYLETGSKKITDDLKINIFPTYIVIDQSGNIALMQNAFSDVLKWLENNE